MIVPTREQLLTVVQTLAALKGITSSCMSNIPLRIQAMNVFGSMRQRLPPMTLAGSAMCAQHGINMAANQNTLGHAERWLAHAPYEHLAESHDVASAIARGDWCISFQPNHQEVLALARELIDFQLHATGAEMCNIGCDETIDIGHGRSAQAVATRGFAAVFGDHVAALARHCCDQGVTPLFWADMALSHPDAFARIPSQAIALAWGYEADSDYAGWDHALGQLKRQWWACPGTASWRSLIGRSEARTGSSWRRARLRSRQRQRSGHDRLGRSGSPSTMAD